MKEDTYEEENKKLMKIVIDTVPRTKKNSSRVVFNKGRTLIIPSKAYKNYEDECLWKIDKVFCNQIDYPVNVACKFYMPTKRRVDLTNLLEAIDDILVKAGVLVDDNRDIIASHNGSLVLYDKENPRVVIEIIELSGYSQWNKKKEK